MKGKVQAPLSFSDERKQKESTDPSSKKQRESPYLKAILSGHIEAGTRVIRMELTDKLAAIRYIRETQWRNRFYRV